ncbi:Dps family protein [Nocardioides sp. SR21]|uniref:Dps family protein n=1 Tax=Nocardioides sp. SR21 TaxID=2919501 RepID=UPI001FAA0F78|nr:DNA starvation/stationary phase protection protein [Nocardioides sp. SR21]
MTLLDTPSDLRRAAACLQPVLTDLLELQAQAKQLHWCVVGPGFASLHATLDAVAGEAAARADELAERMRALGGVPNGRTADVAAGTTLAPAPSGEVPVDVAAAHVVRGIRRAVAAVQAAREEVERLDPASVDLLNGAILAVEKVAWLVAAEGYAR